MLQTVKASFQPKQISGSINAVEIMFWMFYVDRVVETAMWKSIFKIQMLGVPAILYCKTHYYFFCSEICKKTEVIFRETLFFSSVHDKTSCATFNVPLFVSFSLQNELSVQLYAVEIPADSFPTLHLLHYTNRSGHSVLPSHIFITVQASFVEFSSSFCTRVRKLMVNR